MNKVYTSALVAAAIAMTGTTLAPAYVSAWGDTTINGRESYTIDQINNGALDNIITFNSISNGKIGDEKNFVGARVSSDTTSAWNANEINVKDGETYTIRLYVHNNNKEGTDMIAKGVSVNFSLPTNVATTHTVIGYLNSTNATPNRYWDEVKLTSSENFYMEYVYGSAQYRNEKGTFALSDTIINNNVMIGYDSMNGEIPGCFKYDGEVTIQVKVHSSVSAKLAKTVRIKGSGDNFAEVVDAKVGDEVEYQIEYKNLLADTVNDVMIRDVLPTNVEYVADSTYLYNSNYQSGVQIKNNTVATTGINIGSYIAKGNAYVRFTGKVVDKTLACGNNQLVNWASATVNGAVVKDDASVMVAKTCDGTDTPTDTPTGTTTSDSNDNAGTPSSIVATGPEAIVSGALGAGAVTTALGYFIASRKKA